jgi:hypothetical protein
MLDVSTISNCVLIFMFQTYPSSMDGNTKDIVNVWDEHLKCEFETYDVEGAMNTMVKEPYVHDVPVPTGGIGYDGVYNFYKNLFICKGPTALYIIQFCF